MSDKVETRTIKIRVIKSCSMSIEVRIDGSSHLPADVLARNADTSLTSFAFKNCEDWCSKFDDDDAWEPEGLSSPWFPEVVEPSGEPDYIFEVDGCGELELELIEVC